MCCTCCVYNCTQSSRRNSSPAVVAVCTLYIVFTTQLSPAPRPKKGTRTVPFYSALRGILSRRLGLELQYVHIVHSTWRHNCRSTLRPEKGTRTVPLFYVTLRGFLYFDLVKKQELELTHFYLWTQGPPVNICKYLPTTTCG